MCGTYVCVYFNLRYVYVCGMCMYSTFSKPEVSTYMMCVLSSVCAHMCCTVV